MGALSGRGGRSHEVNGDERLGGSADDASTTVRPTSAVEGLQNDLRRVGLFQHLNDERRLDAVEQFAALAEEVGIPMIHMAMAFAIAHPGVTSALIGPRTESHLDGCWRVSGSP